MLGETANIRCAKIPYFQIFVVPDRIPYFDKEGSISKWEMITEHNLKKYIKLSNDNIETFLHTPNKTLVYIVHIQDIQTANRIFDKHSYEDYYLHNDFVITASTLRRLLCKRLFMQSKVCN